MLSLASMCFLLRDRGTTHGRHLVMEALVLYVTHKHSQQRRSAVQAIKIFRERRRTAGREEGERQRAKVKAVVKFSELRSRSCLISALAAGSRQQAAGHNWLCGLSTKTNPLRQLRRGQRDTGTKGRRDSGTLHRTVCCSDAALHLHIEQAARASLVRLVAEKAKSRNRNWNPQAESRLPFRHAGHRGVPPFVRQIRRKVVESQCAQWFQMSQCRAGLSRQRESPTNEKAVKIMKVIQVRRDYNSFC